MLLLFYEGYYRKCDIYMALLKDFFSLPSLMFKLSPSKYMPHIQHYKMAEVIFLEKQTKLMLPSSVLLMVVEIL